MQQVSGRRRPLPYTVARKQRKAVHRSRVNTEQQTTERSANDLPLYGRVRFRAIAALGLAAMTAVSLSGTVPVAAAASSTGVSLEGTFALPGGGHRYVWDASGEIITAYVPPPGFDPLTATTSQLAEYAFPARPTDPQALLAWQTQMSYYKSTSVPSAPVILKNARALAYNSHWFGYVTTASSGYHFIEVEGTFIQPSAGSTACSGSEEVSWVGLGGWTSNNLIQDGIWINTPNTTTP